MKRFFLTSFAILSSILFVGLFGASSVKAQSVFDDAIINSNNLSLLDATNQTSVNYTEDWYEEIVLAIENRCNQSGGQYCIIYNDVSHPDFKNDYYYAIIHNNFNLSSFEFRYTLKSNNPECNFIIGLGSIPTLECSQGTNNSNRRQIMFGQNTGHQQSTEKGLFLSGAGDNNGIFSYATFNGTEYENSLNFINTYPINYPPDYEGEPISDTGSVELDPLYPEYVWTVSKDENDNGVLTVKYQDNLPHFLTGISTLEVMRFTENWEELDVSLGLLPANPAGWADWQFNIGPGQGYYMFRITHNQQLDVPPWGADDNYSIEPVTYQLFWDGQTFINGTTVGCDGIVCNDFTFPDRSENRILSSLNVDTFGLTSIITAPLNFFSQLPTKLANCEPVVLPFPHFGNMTLPCLTPMYQENLGALFTLYQTTLIGAFSYVVGLRIFGRIKDMSNPKDSSIEVIKL